MNKRHILLVLLLVVVIIFNSFVPASAELVLTASVFAVVGTLLVASGMTFNSDSSMTAAVKSFWDSLDSDAKAAVVVIADQYAEFRSANPLKKFVFKATSGIVSALSSWLQGLGVSDSSTSVSVPTGTALTLPVTITFASLSMIQKDSLDDLVSLASSDDVFEFLPGFYLVKVFLSSETNLCMLRLFYLTASGSYNLVPQFRFLVNFPDSETPADAFNFAHYSNNSTPINISLGSSASSIRFSVPVTNGSDNTYIYSDANYFVNGGSAFGSVSIPLAPDFVPAGSGAKPLDSECDVVVPGGLINADTGALDSDLVGTMTPDVVRDSSTDVDVPDVIAGTGTITGEGEGTGIFSSIGKWILNIPILGDILKAILEGFTNLIAFLQSLLESILSAISAAISSIIEFVRDLFIPQGFTWDSFINELQSIVAPPSKVDFRNMVKSTAIPDVTMQLKGQTYTVVDNSYLRNNIATFRGFIGAFLAVLLMIYNYNMFMKLMGYSGLSLNDSRTKGGKEE